MFKARISVIVASICLLSTLVLAQPTYTTPCSVFPDGAFTQLCLTPQQQAMTNQIIQVMNRSLLVPVFLDCTGFWLHHGFVQNAVLGAEYAPSPPTYMPADQAIAYYSDQLNAELARCHPSAVITQGYSYEIAQLREVRVEVIAQGYNMIACILTPEQRACLPPLSCFV